MRLFSSSKFAAVLGLVAAFVAAQANAQQSLVITSFGGDTKKREEWAFYKPFEAATGIKVTSVDYNGGNGQLAAQVRSGNVSWGVVVGEASLVKKSCDEGLLEDISSWQIAPASNGTPGRQDYLPGAISPCGVGFTMWSVALGYQTALPKKPTSVKDFFDLQNFPGKRGLYKQPIYVLEFALLADGVAAGDVHRTLATKEGVDRAFRKLDTIKKDVVWWESWSQGMQLLADKEVVMGMSSSTRMRVAKSERKVPIDILWNTQIVQIDMVMVAKGTRDLAAARKYVEYITRPEVNERVYIPPSEWKAPEGYTRPQSFPARKSVLANAKLTEEDRMAVQPLAAALGGQAVGGQIIVDDGVFWSDHRDQITRRFIEWLQK